MNKIKLIFIPICIGLVLLFSSWYLSYPISIDSPYDFEYNHISFLYWLSLPILFTSFFIVAIKTKNNALQFIMTVCTVLLMHSTVYFHYMTPGSDFHHFIGLTEYFISTGDLSLRLYHAYYQWPIFFILNKIAFLIIVYDLRFIQFMIYFFITFSIASFLYLHLSKDTKMGYISTIAVFIIIFRFFLHEWAPYTYSMIIILLLLYLDTISEKLEVIIVILIIFYIITYTHIITPVFFIIYYFSMYVMKRNKKYLNLFILTLIIYSSTNIYNMLFPMYIKRMSNIFYLEIKRTIVKTLGSSIAKQNFIDVVAQFFSRIVIVTTTIVTGLGFIILILRRKLKRTYYGMLLTGIIFAPSLLISFISYNEIFWRAFPLICIPASLGASYLCESKFKKYFKSIFLILLVLFTFAIIHKTFYDLQIFNLTMREYQYANFMIDNINWNTTNHLLSHFRFMQYLRTKMSRVNVDFDYDSSVVFTKDINKYKYIAYTVGLGKSFMRVNSVERAFTEFEINHFNLIYNSGDFYYIFSR